MYKSSNVISETVVSAFQPVCPAVGEMLSMLMEWVCEACLDPNCAGSSARAQDCCLKVRSGFFLFSVSVTLWACTL